MEEKEEAAGHLSYEINLTCLNTCFYDYDFVGYSDDNKRKKKNLRLCTRAPVGPGRPRVPTCTMSSVCSVKKL